MARTCTSRNYAIQPFKIGSDQSEIELLKMNFRADNLAFAQAQAMIYLRNGAFSIDGLKLLRNGAEVWRWLKREELGLKAKK
jgi:hypothetical protein